MEEKKRIPWRKIAITTAVVCGVSLVAYLGLQVAYASDFDSTRRAAYLHIAGQIKTVFESVFEFLRPFIQLAVLLFVVNWLVKRFNIKVDGFQWQQVNVEKLVVVLLVGGFVALSLKGGLDSLVYAKEVVLVALGFYFGKMRRV